LEVSGFRFGHAVSSCHVISSGRLGSDAREVDPGQICSSTTGF
jgi:hypothetical protein